MHARPLVQEKSKGVSTGFWGVTQTSLPGAAEPGLPGTFQKLLFFSAGGNPRGKFALGLVLNKWQVYVKRPLDREDQDHYSLRITATDGLFVTQAVVDVHVSDVNDNSPVCDQVRCPLCTSSHLLPTYTPHTQALLFVAKENQAPEH